jgi:xylulokinase
MNEMGVPPKRLVAVGGGTKNPLWLQIVSDVTGVAQIVPERTIGASYGNAFLAGVATGIIPSREALNGEWVKISRIVEPDARVRDVYQSYYEVYRRLYESTKDEMHKLAELGSG